MKLPKYGDFSKPADDCMKAGPPKETSYKFTTKTASGETISVQQKIAKKKSAVSTKVELKFGKGKGPKFEKFVADSKSKSFEATASYGGLHPDVKLDCGVKCTAAEAGKMPLGCVDMKGQYKQGDFSANLVLQKLQSGFGAKVNMLYGQAGMMLGGDLKAKADADFKLADPIANIKLGYTVDTTSLFLQSKAGLLQDPLAWKLQMHKKWSGVMATAVEVAVDKKTFGRGGGESVLPIPSMGCKYKVDDDTSVVGKMMFGFNDKLSQYPDLQMAYNQKLTPAAKLKATFQLDVNDLKKLGMALAFEFGDI